MHKTILKNKKLSKNSGNAMLVSVLFFVFISIAILLGLVSPTLRSFKDTRNLVNSKSSLFLANSGLEDYYYRLVEVKPVTSSCSVPVGKDYCLSISLNGSSVDTIVDTLTVNQKEAIAEGNSFSSKIKNRLVVSGGIIDDVFFDSGAGSVGSGGLYVYDDSGASGDIYSNGPVVSNYEGTPRGEGYFHKVISSLSSGFVSNMYSRYIYSNTIEDSSVVSDAYYQNISNTTVNGQSFPGSPDLPAAVFPELDDMIEAFKTEALAGGEILASECVSGDYVAPFNFRGPIKVNCNLIFNGNNSIIGPIWVSGNVTLNPGALITSNHPYHTGGINGYINVPIIADNESNRATSSKIIINSDWGGSHSGAGVFFISRNNSSSLGGAEEAISFSASYRSQQGSNMNFFYAPEGIISFKNGFASSNHSPALYAAHKITIKESSNPFFAYLEDYISITPHPRFYSTYYGNWAIDSWEEAID